MSDAPAITLGVPTCNVDRFLPLAFDAILAQDFDDYEVVVCDNQSSDGTWDICQQYAAKDSRFRIYRNDTNIGLAGNFARTISLARGRYYRLTSHDDLMLPSLLRLCVEALDANPWAVLAQARTLVIDDNGDVRYACENESDLRQKHAATRIRALMRSWDLCNEILGVVRTDALRKTGLFNPMLPSADRKVLMELVVQGGFYLVPEQLFLRRIDASSSFGGGRGTPNYEWQEPELTQQGLFPEKYAKMWGDAPALIRETIKALLHTELPWYERIETATVFGVGLSARRGRIAFGRWRRDLLKRR